MSSPSKNNKSFNSLHNQSVHYCMSCGAENSYMSMQPCKCGCNAFTREKPAKKVFSLFYCEHCLTDETVDETQNTPFCCNSLMTLETTHSFDANDPLVPIIKRRPHLLALPYEMLGLFSDRVAQEYYTPEEAENLLLEELEG